MDDDSLIANIVTDAFFSLPASCREVITLVDVEGRSYEEAGRIRGISLCEVARRLRQSRLRIRDRLVLAGLVAARRARPWGAPLD